MDNQWWSYILTIVGVTGFFFVGRKVWWSWYINLGCQALWVAYALITQQYGFIFAAAFYTVVFGKNAWQWTKEHFTKVEPPAIEDPMLKKYHERLARRSEIKALLINDLDVDMRLEYVVVTHGIIVHTTTMLVGEIDVENEQVHGTDLSTNEYRTLDWSKAHGGWTYFKRPDVGGVFKTIIEGR